MGRLTGGYVFGYGSLVLDGRSEARPATLPGYRRVWGVATDNVQAIPGYKMYLRRSDGVRPAIYVAFLDLEPDPEGEVGGTMRPVSQPELAELDRRERNYDRIEVTDQIVSAGAEPDGPVWTYRGSEAGRERLRRGRAEGRAVISRDYATKVAAGLRALGDEEHARFLASSDLEGLAVWDLERIDLPPDAPPAEEGA
jgi:hypothetical protein